MCAGHHRFGAFAQGNWGGERGWLGGRTGEQHDKKTRDGQRRRRKCKGFVAASKRSIPRAHSSWLLTIKEGRGGRRNHGHIRTPTERRLWAGRARQDDSPTTQDTQAPHVPRPCRSSCTRLYACLFLCDGVVGVVFISPPRKQGSAHVEQGSMIEREQETQPHAFHCHGASGPGRQPGRQARE